MTRTALATTAILSLVCVTPVFLAIPASATSACAEIEDREVRLRCYDAEYRATSQSATESAEQSSESGTTDTATPALSNRSQRGSDRADFDSNRDRGKADKDKEASKAALPKSPVRGYPHRVLKITTRGVDKRQVYELDNGERWVQTRTQIVTIREKDAVAVKSSMTGRKYISTARGSTAWVEPMP